MGNKASAWWGAHKPTTRRLVQLYAALLYNAHLKGFIKGDIYTGPAKNICLPGLNCYSCPGAVSACPLGALQNALASSGNRAPFYLLGILMLFGLTLGRTICGWFCPFGLIQELLHKLPTPKLRKNKVTRALTWVKYLLLAVFVVAIPLYFATKYIPLPAFCKYICPAGTFEGAIGLLSNPVNADKFSMLNIFFTRKFVILVLIFTACIFIYRAFCRFLCPLGAIYGLFARLSVLGVKVEATACTHCGLCVARCKMDIHRVGDHECIHCGDCIGGCPTKAIRMKFGKITLLQNEGKPGEQAAADASAAKARKARGMAAWVVALAVLAGVLWYVNAPAQNTPPAPPPTNTTDAGTGEAATGQAAPAPLPTGKEVGMRCPDFTVPLYGAAGGSFAPYTGKATIINFWATWCTPCVGELPYFQQVYDTYGDKVALVAIHSNLVTDDVDAFLARLDYTFPFALDETGEVIAALGGSTMLPMTVVLDADGTIIYNKVGSVTYEQLDSLLAPLLG